MKNIKKVFANYKSVSIVLLALLLYNNTSAQTITADSVTGNSILARDAKLILIDSSFSFTEGPARDRSGNIFFTDQPNDNIWKYDTKGKLSLFLHGAHRSNGMYFDEKGDLISCADANDELIAISPEKKITVLVKGYKGHLLNGPNDIWIDPSGGMYITDPYYQRDYWTRKNPDSTLGGEKLYYLTPNKKELIRVDSTTIKPNGIVGTPDGQYLYVADMGDWKTYRYNINKDGTLTNKKLFANEASDGMTIDERGNIYLTGNGVMVYDAAGKKIEHINVPAKMDGEYLLWRKEQEHAFYHGFKVCLYYSNFSERRRIIFLKGNHFTALTYQ